MKRRAARWKWIAIAIAIAAAGAAAALLPMADWLAEFEGWLERMGLASAILAFCAINVVANLLLIPAWIFPVAAGAVFGLAWGLVAAAGAATISSLAAFLLSRHLLRGRLEKLVRGNATFKSFEKAVAGEGWKVVALMRLSPVLSSGMKSYFFGLTRIRLATYTGASAVGMLPGLVIKVFVGAAGYDALQRGALEWTLLAVGIIATVTAAVMVKRLMQRRLHA
jgi:uncharacterized membrane protein YdjX (TVP38/TMEM64 family)